MTVRTLPRRRPRAIDETPAAPTPEQLQAHAQALAAEVFTLNKTMNAAKNAHDKKRDELFAFMKRNKLRPFNFVREMADRPVSIDVTFEFGTVAQWDMDKMLKDMSKDQIKVCWKPQKEAVEKTMGKAYIAQVYSTQQGEERVCVKAAK